jgi:hypothetical protein
VTSLGLIENCRRRKIAPWKYLVRIFEKPPRTKVTAEAFAPHTLAAYAEKIRPRQHANKTGRRKRLNHMFPDK